MRPTATEAELQSVFGQFLEENGFIAGKWSVRRQDVKGRTLWFLFAKGQIQIYSTFTQLPHSSPLLAVDVNDPESFDKLLQALTKLFDAGKTMTAEDWFSLSRGHGLLL
jgi:hypothetical protein